MSSLAAFQPPPRLGYVTLCERNGELIAAVAKEAEKCTLIQDYPSLNLSQDTAKPSTSKESARSAFLEHHNTLQKKLHYAWCEHGIVGVLEELASDDEHSEKPQWVTKSASYIIGAVRWAMSLHGSLFPHLALSNTDMIAEFSSTVLWKESPARCFAWHPHTNKFAVAHNDDCVRVYTLKKTDIVPLLKHKLQKGVAALAWKPESASVLAVACQSCVLIWHVDPLSLASRPSTNSVQVLSQSGHMPVTSLAWSPREGLLLSGSPADTAMMVWEVATETCVPLRRIGGGGVTMIKWSPDGSKVLAACPSPVFRVWETRRWSCEKWTQLQGRVKAACWSSDGQTLLFATTDEPIIYYLSFSEHFNENQSVIGGSAAVACANLSEVEMQTDDGPVIVGGPIQSLAWDQTCERLAVQFTDKSQSCDKIAVFQTRLYPIFEVIPCGFIQGYPDEIPCLMNFQPKFNEGALLTVVWNSGRVTFLPMYFLTRAAVEDNRFIASQLNGHVQSPKMYSSP